VSREVAQEILERGEDIALGGTRRRITVLFTDIRGFTSLSERLRPEEVVEILNGFFTRLSIPILRHKGTLDKFIGDAIMAFWGAPLSHGEDAVRAVGAALEMLRDAEAMSGELEGRYAVRLEIGVGISTGEAVVGNIGSPERMGYTAIGDTVNIAARLQDLTKEYKSPLLISHTTYEEVKYSFATERVGFVPVKGRTEPVGIYRVLGEKPAPLATRR
jgi:adenylate cyclase